MAPEILGRDGYDEKCDMWSCGVLLYVLLSGTPPFHGKDDPETYRLILKGEVSFPEKRWRRISHGAKDLINRMLTSDPVKRISAEEAYKHPWVQDASTLSPVNLEIMDSLAHFTVVVVL